MPFGNYIKLARIHLRNSEKYSEMLIISKINKVFWLQKKNIPKFNIITMTTHKETLAKTNVSLQIILITSDFYCILIEII
jgi:hypothetical protein